MHKESREVVLPMVAELLRLPRAVAAPTLRLFFWPMLTTQGRVLPARWCLGAGLASGACAVNHALVGAFFGRVRD